MLRKANLILSITSIPERVELFLSNLHWLAEQTVQSRVTVIWLGSEYFSDSRRQYLSVRFPLPADIEIRYRPDLGPHTKLLYALKEFDNLPIVTADDDILYPPFWLEELYASFQSAPQYVHCFRAHEMRITPNGHLAPYLSWNWLAPGIRGPSRLLFPTGTSGVIYPATALSKQVFDVEVMRALCPTSDDIWFKAMSLLNRTLVQKVRTESLEFPQIDGSERRVLWRTNVEQNDVQLHRVFHHYGLYDYLF